MAPSFSSIKKKLTLHSSSSSVSLESVPSSDELSPARATDFEAADSNTTQAPSMSNTTTTEVLPHHADANTPGGATFVLQACSQDGQPQALGSSAADPAHPDVLADRDGVPVTSVPHTTQQFQGVLGSGERGLGPTGTATLQRMHATTQVGPGIEAVVGEAQGVAPEAMAGVEAVEVGEARATEPWYRRIVKKDRSSSSLSPDDNEGDAPQPKSLQAIDALATVAPTEVTGADLSNVGLSQNDKATVGTVTDKDGNPVPTKLQAKGEPSMTPSVTTSIKDQISNEHSPDPHTSNERFHELFPSIPTDDELIEDYRCALQREILMQGRLFISERHISFRANILGWETSVSIPWSEVTTIEKKMTAIVIPNAIEISTPHARHLFASFINREPAYELFVSLWTHAHPEGPRLRSGSESSTGVATDSKSELSYTDDEGTKKRYHFKPHIPSALKIRNFSRDSASVKSSDEQTPAEKVKADAQANDDGGHPPTEYDGEEFKNVAMDVVLPTSPELAYGLFFTDKEFLTKFLNENQGVKELNMGDWKDEKTRDMSYIKPLNAPMGPKETLVNLKDENEKADPETYYTTVTESHTPDVPSGSNFFVMTRTVITWSAGGGAHVKVTTEVTWTKINRMLKGIIERSCLDGQKTYHKDLETAVREEIAANKAKYAVAGASDSEESTVVATDAPSEGVLSIIASFLPSPVLILSILVVILLFSNFFTLISLRHQARALHAARLGSPEEVASAVQRVLGGFSEAHGKQGRGVMLAAKELEGVKALARSIEVQLGQLRDRLAGL